MKVYLAKPFARWARKERLAKGDLCQAAREIGDGLVDARLGGLLVKKRIARTGGGKSGGYRTIVMFRAGERIVFLYGFPKNAQSNLSPRELETYLALAKIFDGLPEKDMARLSAEKELTEVACDEF
ncbi:MAG: type II toxin-antitoxin system RelE/ParE family toxin [Parvibaculum sp.]|uniref:type II toxin-antitoxin system RelE/ParE family toxin n=1 Tax=Parvibaculum sp. TaxID=2024848 RepID=UPI000CC4EC7C|nr:type II toxin-antitoxin system RelE/ParE family toxin [Parvibaculum sp.]MDZ4380903.1 type II toxin-antitoxin system RelE/ParE family toxin [Parvibaculum sp.]PKP77130.1 MAG: hypothetical protein CVT81_11010 [Alphaproteobacteria bacterium HGW-Alphaproteobacteria-3]